MSKIINTIRVFFAMSILSSFSNSIMAQNSRLNDYNAIGWYNYFGTFKISDKLGIHAEYQFRRNKIISEWQQSLLRLGINYQINPKLQFRFGYAWIETFPYGRFPINVMMKDFTEHRMFQMATITDNISIVDLSHRFMLEQRWVGRYSNTSQTREEEFIPSHRLRYMFRMQIPLKRKESKDKLSYLAIYDEIFVGFGKNVTENIFDQNRLGVVLGYKFASLVRIEAGYLNQILQLGREVNNQNVFQNNHGIIINVYANIDWTAKN